MGLSSRMISEVIEVTVRNTIRKIRSSIMAINTHCCFESISPDAESTSPPISDPPLLRLRSSFQMPCSSPSVVALSRSSTFSVSRGALRSAGWCLEMCTWSVWWVWLGPKPFVVVSVWTREVKSLDLSPVAGRHRIVVPFCNMHMMTFEYTL